jgi:hypothetical protein
VIGRVLIKSEVLSGSIKPKNKISNVA